MKSAVKNVKDFANNHSVLVFLSPFVILFLLFIIIPIGAAVGLSFTDFNTVQMPHFIGIKNYVPLFTSDTVFMQKVLPNTIIYAVFVGCGGYILSFFLAWSLSQITRRARTIMAIIIYSPSLTGTVMISTIFSVIFNGDESGYLNYLKGIKKEAFQVHLLQIALCIIFLVTWEMFATYGIIDDFFFQMSDNFDIMTTSNRNDDIVNHLDVFQPDILIYCMNADSVKDFNRMYFLKEKLAKNEELLTSLQAKLAEI